MTAPAVKSIVICGTWLCLDPVSHFEQDTVNEERNEKCIESQCVCGNLWHIHSTQFFVYSFPLHAGPVEKGTDKRIQW